MIYQSRESAPVRLPDGSYIRRFYYVGIGARFGAYHADPASGARTYLGLYPDLDSAILAIVGFPCPLRPEYVTAFRRLLYRRLVRALQSRPASPGTARPD